MTKGSGGGGGTSGNVALSPGDGSGGDAPLFTGGMAVSYPDVGALALSAAAAAIAWRAGTSSAAAATSVATARKARLLLSVSEAEAIDLGSWLALAHSLTDNY